MGNEFPITGKIPRGMFSPRTLFFDSFLKGGYFLSKILPIKNSPVTAVESDKANCTEFIRYDENGQVIADTVRKSRSQNGSGFVISYTAKMCDFVTKTAQGSVVRLFVYLAHNQQFGVDGKAFGYRCSHKFLQQVLNVDRKTIYNALTYLEKNFLVIETIEDGQSEFMVNPDYVTIGTDKRVRMREWNARWERHWKQG